MNTIPLGSMLKKLKTLDELQPTAQFRTNARIRLLNQMKNDVSVSYQSRGQYRVIRWLASLGAAFALAGTGVVYAAQGSAPGAPLYPLKVASEQIAVSIAPTKEIKTEVVTTIIDRRASEIAHLEDVHKEQDILKALDAYEKTVKTATRAARVSLSEVDAHVDEHKTYISEVKKRAGDAKELQKEEKKQEKDVGEKYTEEKEMLISPILSPVLSPTILPESLPVEVHSSIEQKKEHSDLFEER